jgi:hypothetical protein
MDIQRHLTQARSDLAEIETLTRNLGAEPSMAEIDDVLRKRDVIVCRLKSSERELDVLDPAWTSHAAYNPASKRLAEEAKALLHSIGEIDGRLANMIESRMAGVRRQLTFIYRASRAAGSYTAHSVLRAAG